MFFTSLFGSELLFLQMHNECHYVTSTSALPLRVIRVPIQEHHIRDVLQCSFSESAVLAVGGAPEDLLYHEC